MKTGPVLVFPPSNERQVQQGPVRVTAGPPLPILGSGASGKNRQPQNHSSVAIAIQDAVEVQWNAADRIMVYEFVNQQGTLILQVPSEQLLSLAEQVSQELAREAAPKVPARSEGGKNHGH